jgi:hypothetical protein
MARLRADQLIVPGHFSRKIAGEKWQSFPGRSTARSGALQTRDRYERRVWDDPGSAVHG